MTGKYKTRKCSICKQSCNSPNNHMEAKLEKIKKEYLCEESYLRTIKNKTIINEDELNPSSVNVCDYLIKPIFVWLPHLHVNMDNIKCWSCSVSGCVKFKEYKIRNVEDVSTNGFIIFPNFRCNKCKSTSTSLQLDNMRNCGFPNNILRRCPVGEITYLLVKF